MQTWILGIILLLSSVPVWAQSAGEIDPNIKVSNATNQPPASSLDLLQQSVKKDDSVVSTTGRRRRVPRKPTAASTTTVSTTTVSTTTAAAPMGANTLDMPLPLGGATTSVKTQIAPVKPKPTPKRPTTISTESVTTVASSTTASAELAENTEEEDAADAELEYAVKMLEKSKEQALSGRSIPPSAAKNRPAKVPAANKAFNPNAFRPGVEWLPSKSTHFDIYTQKPTGGLGSANMSLIFETAYNTLRRFIPWMMSGKVRAFVYQDHNSYLRYEPEAKAWTRAIAYPTRGEVVVYDDPGHTQELKEVFSHELTHIFTQKFFDKHDTGRIMTPTWIDEGLAVLVEDQMYSGKQRGGPWDHDYRTLRFERDPRTMNASFSSKSMFGGKAKTFTPPTYRQDRAGGIRRGKPVRLIPFEDFMQEDSLNVAEGKGDMQNWYLQAYLMVRFLLNPAGGSSPSNRMQFEQFTRLIAEGEAVRNPSTGFLVKDARGKQVYEPYSVEKALAKAYRYNSISAFEDAFWKWLNK